MTPELIIALALTAADASQTEYIARHPTEHCEYNPLLGRHPTQAKVGAYFAASASALLLANQLLPAKQAQALNWVWVGAEGSVVAHNLRVGIRFNF